MTVQELIQVLQMCPQDLVVAYEKYSDQCVMDPEELKIISACEPDSRGWIQNARPDKPQQKYLMFPGN